MNEPTNGVPTPSSVTGRRHRFTGAHPYPALPKSRLPLIRGVLWVTWAAFLALLDGFRGLIPGVRRTSAPKQPELSVESHVVARPSRLPSLTPTG